MGVVKPKAGCSGIGRLNAERRGKAGDWQPGGNLGLCWCGHPLSFCGGCLSPAGCCKAEFHHCCSGRTAEASPHHSSCHPSHSPLVAPRGWGFLVAVLGGGLTTGSGGQGNTIPLQHILCLLFGINTISSLQAASALGYYRPLSDCSLPMLLQGL